MTNGMVFCRGCGKEIHSTAPMCPMCGAPQGVAQASAPIAPAVAAAQPKQRIEFASRQDLPDTWKRRFELIEKAGGPNLPNFRSLETGERMTVGFNILGFLFGPIYYLIKGLWQQALVYVGLYLFVMYGLLPEYASNVWILGIQGGFAALYASRANIAYYKKEVLGEVTWFW